MTPTRWALVWAFVFLFELYLLLTDLPFLEPERRRFTDHRTKVAELIHRQNSVRIKDPGDVVWREQLSSAELYENQSLMTLADSTARLQMTTGEELAVAPESLIELRRESGSNSPLVIALLKGKVSGRKMQTELNLQTRTRKVRISPGTEWTLKESIETPGVQVLELKEGEAKIETESGVKEIKAGQQVRISEDPKIEVSPASSVEEIWEKAAKPIPLKMKLQEEPPPPPPPKALPPPERLKKPEFRRKSQIPKKSPYSWILDLVIPSAHAEGASTKQSWDVKLNWEPVEGATSYKIQIARIKSFTYPLVNTQVSTPEYHWAYQLGMENSKGRVYYRIASVSEAGKVGKYSAPVALEIPPEILAEARGTPRTKTAQATKRPSPTRFSWQAGLATGLGNLSQTSSTASLESVKLDSIFFHQHLSGGGIWRTDLSEFALNLRLGAANFGDSDEYPRTPQETVRPWNMRLDATLSSNHESPWRWGASVDRQFRWVKEGKQSVTPTGAFSVGPYASYMMKISKPAGFSTVPVRIAATLAAPISGLLTKDYYGGELNLAGLWKLGHLGSSDTSDPKQIRSNWIGLTIEADFRYLRWTTPAGTSLFAWNIWIAPQFLSEEW